MIVQLVSIHKSQKRDLVTEDQLTLLANIVGGDDWLDYGFHNSGLYSQLHFHGILLGFHPFIPQIDGYRVFYKRIRTGVSHVLNYIHKDDYDCKERLKNILLINKYRYNYYPYD